ncbi:hypothetical protein [Streptomyces sp. NPDC059398]|uniref:hypothetical protein n=1 Tax=Streptomyces sp. NPDC059398 TaxID=3346820 RepID=UPI0036CC6EB0
MRIVCRDPQTLQQPVIRGLAGQQRSRGGRIGVGELTSVAGLNRLLHTADQPRQGARRQTLVAFAIQDLPHQVDHPLLDASVR